MRRNVKSRLKRDFFLTVRETVKPELFEKISDIVTPLIEPLNGYLVDLTMRGEGGSSVVEIYIDTDEGITADQCAEISRGISAELDRHAVLTGRYRLEVSSPGLDRPLKLGRQFAKNIGRTLKVVSDANSETITVTGILEGVSGVSLTISTPDQRSISLSLADVREAYVLPQIKKRVY